METSAIDRRLPTLAPLGRRLLRWLGDVGRRLGRTRLSLRVLRVLVLAIGGGLGWAVRGAKEQRDAVAAVAELNGSVTYDIEWRNATPNPYRRHSWSPMQLYDGRVDEVPGLKWVIGHVGLDYFANVVDVRLVPRTAGTRVRADDATLAKIGRLRRLEDLNLNGTAVTDDGLAHLEGLTELRGLDLSNTRVTDAGLAHLKKLHNLRGLYIVNAGVTDTGLNELEEALPMIQIIRKLGVRPRLPRALRGRRPG